MRQRMGWVLVLVLFIPVAATAHAKDKSAIVASPSIKNGDPPPAIAENLTMSQARIMIEDAIKKRYIGKLKTLFGGGLGAIHLSYQLSEATNVRVWTSGLKFTAPYDGNFLKRNEEGRVFVKFVNGGGNSASEQCVDMPEEYLQVYRPDIGKSTINTDGKVVWGHEKVLSPSPFYSVASLPDPEHAVSFFHCFEDLTIFAWTDETAAHEFADAFNRLLFAAHRHEIDPEFIAAAKTWP